MPDSNVTDGRTDGCALQVLTLGLGGEIFALESAQVREVLDMVELTEVPGARSFVKGLVNVRGKVVPVVDLKTKFDMPALPPTEDSRIVVIEVSRNGEDSMVGVLTDRVLEVTELPQATLEDVPRVGMTWQPDFIRAIGKRDGDFVIVMDIAAIFSSEGPGGRRKTQP
ncbi:chemotaxis protein CheW [Telmatospirillum sp. J64-1]|uniref:chemotaxis protein CheW n=1 Tax=Telmatospirillum sp. J64-1 TaxID=2502183 RepID=UPI0021024A7A|nr:chemotaxis protein CheW [Telmatospirillum sp. J64-1]